MPKYRIPIRGALLLETDSPEGADLWAGCWCASAMQMTMRVETDVIHESVTAVHLEIENDQIVDVAPELERAKQRLYAERDPKTFLELSRLTFPEITEQQTCFVFYERECRKT